MSELESRVVGLEKAVRMLAGYLYGSVLSEADVKTIGDQIYNPQQVSTVEQELWNLLDTIDTLLDACHPSTAEEWEEVARHMVAIAEKRHLLLKSDGYKLSRNT